MKLTSILRLGEHFGSIESKVRGIVTYKLSPFEQAAFSGLGKSIPNCFGRITNVLITVLPYFLVGYTVYKVVEEKHEESLRKNPDDYKEFYEGGGAADVAFKSGKIIVKKWPKFTT